MFATPASSAADERSFSMADHTVNQERPRTLVELANINMTLKSWYDEDLI